MYYVYLLEEVESKSRYIGYTSDIKRRLAEHQSGSGGRTTRAKKGWRLIYYEMYLDERDALGRERFLKSESGWRFVEKQLKNYLQNRSGNG